MPLLAIVSCSWTMSISVSQTNVSYGGSFGELIIKFGN